LKPIEASIRLKTDKVLNKGVAIEGVPTTPGGERFL
jgi:hypothetical protein